MDFPKEIRYREQYASRLQTFARQYETDRQPEKASVIYQQLMEVREKLVEDYPAVVNYQRDLDVSYSRLGNNYRASKQWQKSADIMTRIVLLRSRILKSGGYLAKDRYTLASRLYLWGRDLGELQKHEEAIEKLQESLTHYEALPKDGSSSSEMIAGHGHTCMQLGYELLAVQQWKLAHETFLKALPLREKLFSSGKTSNNRNMLSKCHYMLFQTYWYVKYDFAAASYHYALSSIIDPVYCEPLVDPSWLIKTTLRYGKATPQSTSPIKLKSGK
ncbi:MAG: tetratricopeptide repeat protein [Gemmatales bacterium]